MKLMVDKHTQTYDLEREDSMDSIDFNYWNFYFMSMDHLASVKLKYCKLKDMKVLFLVFHQLKNLKHLNLSHNNITVIYGTFLNLVDFDISYNSLNDISFSTLNQIIACFRPNLKRINLENNQLTKLKLSPSRLESIKANNNNITRVYGQNNNLIKLNLSGTSISKLPCLKLTCSNLKKLSLNNLNNFTLPPFNDLKNIHFLSLSYSKFNATKNMSSISTTPSNLKYLISKNSPSVFSLLEQWDPVMFINLQYLDISDNKLSCIPNFILDKCNNLIALEANDNQIRLEKEIIPNQLFFLSLKNNLINNIEAFINCKNVNLTCLDLRFNPLLESFKSDQQTKVLFWAFKAWFPNLSKFLGKRW
ncbi:L domain-like protein [Neoconidiobolus thromboides FSU 785]|nr:L domain-like protein [Neoconidiobolus thromboides FSU 785]